MMSVADCRQYLKGEYTDEQVESMRNFLYALAKRIVKQEVEGRE